MPDDGKIRSVETRLCDLEDINRQRDEAPAFDAAQAAQGNARDLAAATNVRNLARIARLREALHNILGQTKFDLVKSVFREAEDALNEDGRDWLVLHCPKCGHALSCGGCLHPAK